MLTKWYVHLFFLLAIRCLANGQEVNEQACKKLHEAVANNNISQVVSALKFVDANCRDEEGRSAMHVFAERGTQEMIFFSLFHQGSALLNLASKKGMTPLMEAVAYGNSRAFLSLVWSEDQNNPLDIDEQNYAGNTALHMAVMNNDSTSVSWLLRLGADTDIKNMEGKTAKDIANVLYLKEIKTIFFSNNKAKKKDKK